MQRTYKSRIYYIFGYSNKIKGIPSFILGIRIPIGSRRRGGGYNTAITIPPH